LENAQKEVEKVIEEKKALEEELRGQIEALQA
jgi:hypothetical protein